MFQVSGIFCFFFSSRRRHTRFDCDWSSDVCSSDLTDLEFTVLIYICLGVTNDGIGWHIGASRQSVERILSGTYRKMKIVSRRGAPQGVPTLLESRTRLCYESITRGLINTNLLREEDRSEEHTSELQSQSNIVCRLLLEKKKT